MVVLCPEVSVFLVAEVVADWQDVLNMEVQLVSSPRLFSEGH